MNTRFSTQRQLLHVQELTHAAYLKQDFTATAHYAKMLVTLDPLHIWGYQKLIEATLIQGELFNVIQIAQNAYLNNPENPVVCHLLGCILLGCNTELSDLDLARSVELLRTAVQKEPQNQCYQRDLGEAYSIQGSFNLASRAYRKASNLNDQHALYLEGRKGLSLIGLKRYEHGFEIVFKKFQEGKKRLFNDGYVSNSVRNYIIALIVNGLIEEANEIYPLLNYEAPQNSDDESVMMQSQIKYNLRLLDLPVSTRMQKFTRDNHLFFLGPDWSLKVIQERSNLYHYNVA